MAKCFLRSFVIVPLTFYSSMRQSYDSGCASSSDAQFHRTLLYTFARIFFPGKHFDSALDLIEQQAISFSPSGTPYLIQVTDLLNNE